MRRALIESLRGQVEVFQRQRAYTRAVEAGFASLGRGRLHELLADHPPLCVLAGLARRGLEEGGVAFWIGRACWPHPRVLAGGEDAEGLRRHVLIDPLARDRLWTLDTVLRSPAAAVVVADAQGLDMAATRRLQLAAEAGGALALLARSTSEQRSLSTATTRWLVEPVVNETEQAAARWRVRLLRSKDAYRHDGRRSFDLEWRDDAGLVCVAEELADRPAATREAG